MTGALASESRAAGQAAVVVDDHDVIPCLLPEDRADEGTLACLEHVSIPERDPETLQACGRLPAVVEFLTGPPLFGWLMDLKLEDVPVLDLVSVWADVVGGLPELAHDAELAEAGFLARLAQGCVCGGFAMPDASGRDLDPDLLQVVVGVPEDQQLAVADDIAQHFAGVDLVRHSFPSWLGGGSAAAHDYAGLRVQARDRFVIPASYI